MGEISKRFHERSSSFSSGLALLALGASFVIPSLSLPNTQEGTPMLNIPLICIGCVFLALGAWLTIWSITTKLDSEIPSLKHSVEHSTKIWGIWWTGKMQFRMFKKPEYTSKYKRILLLDFNKKELFSNIMTTAAGSKNKLHEQNKAIKQIKRFTKLAIASGVEVRWYSKIQVYSFTLYDPEDLRAYIVKSDLQQEPNRKRRRLSWFRITEDKEKQKFDEYKIEFQHIWGSERLSRVPLEEEYQ